MIKCNLNCQFCYVKSYYYVQINILDSLVSMLPSFSLFNSTTNWNLFWISNSLIATFQSILLLLSSHDCYDESIIFS
jgi:hypothetical protein